MLHAVAPARPDHIVACVAVVAKTFVVGGEALHGLFNGFFPYCLFEGVEGGSEMIKGCCFLELVHRGR